MTAAQRGRLDTPAGLADEVDRMLNSPRLEAGVRALFTDMLQFDLFDTLAKDAKIYPKWTVKAAQDAQEQTLHSHEGLSSPTLRGKALRELLLCEPVPAPPGNVNFAAAQDTHNPDFKTMRARLTAHRTDPTCAGCHKLMDPMGLALENFDSDAGYRTVENGQLIDTRGELDGIEFTDAAGLGRALHDNPATGPCFVRRLYSYATGRAVVRRDMAWVRYLEKAFAADGYRPPDLMRRIAASENFYRVTLPAPMLASSGALMEETGK